MNVRLLLDELCIELGFCLPPDDQERFVENPPADVDAFTAEVFAAEGLDPVYADKKLRSQVRERVARHFAQDR